MVGVNEHYSQKVSKDKQLGSRPGLNLQPGPYEGVIKEVMDGNRSGRLKVWIPELGTGNQDDPQGWVTVRYASPFAGKTLPKDPKSKLNDFHNVSHTYGFWAVPPDVGNNVLCFFINGDRNRGFWFACILDKLGKGMIPGVGGGYKPEVDDKTIHDADVKKAFNGSLDAGKIIMPLAEMQESDGGNVKEGFSNVKRPIHEYQAKRFFIQGLDRDNVRGARKTGIQMESPSRVFGISTPGRPLKNDAKDDPGLIAKLNSGDFSKADVYADGRKGGHSLVMDDGRFAGGGEMIRIRSAEGHQILMDDEKGTFYMINAEGTVWVEMAKSGHMSIYTAKGFNLRSDDDINIHTEKNFNIYAKEKINIKTVTDFNLETNNINTVAKATNTHYGATVKIGASGGLQMSSGTGSWKGGSSLLLSAGSVGLNSGAGPTVAKPPDIPPVIHPDVVWNGGKFQWEEKPAILNSIVKIAPTHEPWKRDPGEFAAKVVTATVASTEKEDKKTV